MQWGCLRQVGIANVDAKVDKYVDLLMIPQINRAVIGCVGSERHPFLEFFWAKCRKFCSVRLKYGNRFYLSDPT